MDLKDHIRGIPDFPKPGILFYDISTLLADADAWQVTSGRLAKAVAPFQPDVLVGIESRGFLVAAPLALKLGCGFVMARKEGKLPGQTVSYTYDLEYGSDTIEMQSDAIHPGQRVVILDDLLATGGTLCAAIELVKKMGGKPVGAKLCVGKPHEIFALMKAMLETGIRLDFIVVDGAEGGTGAAPVEFSNRVGMPLREGLILMRNALVGAGLKDEIKLAAAGKVHSGAGWR